MNDNKFWVCTWSIVATAIVLVAAIICASGMYDTNKSAELIAGGADPIGVKCAINSNSASPLCLVKAATK